MRGARLFILLQFALLLVPLRLGAEEAKPAPEEAQPGDARTATAGEWQNREFRELSYKSDELAAALFDLLEDIPIVDIKAGSGKFGVRVGRQVYDNHDVLGSFTVIDRFRASLTHPFFSTSEPMGGGYIARFAIGSSLGLDWLHIRPVLPNQFEHLAQPEDEAAEIHKALGEAPALVWNPAADEAAGTVSDANEPPVWTLNGGNPSSQPAQAFDGLTKARYGRLWNLLALPLRTPWGGNGVERLRPGEIISYLADGQVQVGPSIGLELNIPGIDRLLEARAFARIFVDGQFRISVWREDQDHAQVKVTRIASFGRRVGFGGSSEEMIKGAVVLDHSILHGQTSVSPFSYNNTASSGRSIDLVYRYDLRDPVAREAFHRAVLGRLGPSESAAGGARWREQPVTAAVRRIGRRVTDFRTHFRSTSTRFGLLYRHFHDTGTKDADIRLDISEGVKKAWRSEAKNNSRWRWIWGLQERRSYSFRVNIDRNRLAAGLPDATTLTVSGDLSDTSTTAPELYDYINEVESATGRPRFFPRPPRSFPVGNPPTGLRERENPRLPFPPREVVAVYGRTSFFYQVTYDERQLARFLDTPDHERWPAMEKAFAVAPGTWGSAVRRSLFAATHGVQTVLNLPLYVLNIHLRSGDQLIEAHRAVQLWRKAAKESDPLRRATLVAGMFSTRRYSAELSRLLRVRLAGEPVSYAIQGASYAWGKLREEGNAATAIDPLTERLQRVIDFDRRGPRPQSDPQANMTLFGASPIDYQRLRISLTLPDGVKPRAFYLRLVEQVPWHLPRTISELVVVESGEHIGPGANKLIIDRRSGYLSALFAQTRANQRYELQVALTINGRDWGPIASSSFTMPAEPVPEAPVIDDPLRPLLRPTDR